MKSNILKLNKARYIVFIITAIGFYNTPSCFAQRSNEIKIEAGVNSQLLFIRFRKSQSLALGTSLDKYLNDHNATQGLGIFFGISKSKFQYITSIRNDIIQPSSAFVKLGIKSEKKSVIMDHHFSLKVFEHKLYNIFMGYSLLSPGVNLDEDFEVLYKGGVLVVQREHAKLGISGVTLGVKSNPFKNKRITISTYFLFAPAESTDVYYDRNVIYSTLFLGYGLNKEKER
ncbi:MAG: hypothetical protein OEY34_07210 [Cyclobacteriaceae bacterium]|nr:hypothetical protein [Cyclobacteriaceae bacterium]